MDTGNVGSKPSVKLPQSKQQVDFEKIYEWSRSPQPQPDWTEFGNNIVVIGANGAGKSRLGELVEAAHKDTCHRISAQRALKLPEETQFISLEKANLRLFWGDENNYNYGIKNSRWSQDILDDFSHLLQVLLSEDFSVSTEFRRAQKRGSESPAPETKLDKILDIWNSLLPLRHIDTEGNKVVISLPKDASTKYRGSEASDGEKVLFYLIGQTLAAPPNAILILDEPEIHIHKAILAKLWDELEKARRDCLFVYLTHDLDFAASRIDAKKIWLKSFDGQAWEWEELSEQEGIPDDVYLKLLGSRKPVLFVEGSVGSLDRLVYEIVYSDFTISYCGSCEEVIRNTRAFRNKQEFHQIRCFGLIDRDGRSSEEINQLENSNIFSTKVAEIENLLMTEEVLRLVARHLGKRGQELEDVVDKIQDKVLSEYKKIKNQLITKKAQERLEKVLPRRIGKLQSKSDFGGFWNRLQSEIDPKQIYKDAEAEVEKILGADDYLEALKHFHQKGLVPQTASLLGLSKVLFIQQIQNPNLQDSLASSFQQHLPVLPSTQPDKDKDTKQKERVS